MSKGLIKRNSTHTKAHKLVPRLRFPEFARAGEWEVKRLCDILNYEQPTNYIVISTKYEKNGIPVLTANKSFILGYTNETDDVFTDVPIILFDDFTTDKKYVDFPFKVKSSAIKILKCSDNYNIKIIFTQMCNIKFEIKAHKRYYISEYQNIPIALPSRPEQQRIADCLTSLDELITAQTRKLELLKEHKEGLMQQLFPNLERTAY